MPTRRNGYGSSRSNRSSSSSSSRGSARQSGGTSSRSSYAQRGSHARPSANAKSAPRAGSRAGSRTASRSSVRASGGQTRRASAGKASGAGRTAARGGSAAVSAGGSYRLQTEQSKFAAATIRRSRRRRILTIGAIVLVALAIAIGAGYLAFRGTVGSGFALKDSNAGEALVQVKSTEPYYALVAVELGAAAEPLEKAGPDVILLARVDRQNHTLALVNIPSGLQITVDTSTRRLGDVAEEGDAALVSAVATFAKVDISHFVKVDESGLATMVDKLGGIETEIDQEIDDPHAGSVYLPEGTATLDAVAALTYLRATNLTLGEADQLAHQSYFAALLLHELFGGQGSLASRLDAVSGCFQTDFPLGEIEELADWVADLGVGGITRVTLPGYSTDVAGVVETGDALYVAKAENMAAIIEALDAGDTPTFADSSNVDAAPPSSFTVEVQNGTDITGAASTTASSLTSAGFRVEKTGNAEQQVFNETLVVYKDDASGPAQAKAVIDALGIGRAVDGAAYYEFDTDVLLVIGYDYKPVS